MANFIDKREERERRQGGKEKIGKRRERESERFEVLREKNASPSAIYQRDTRVRPNHCWPTSSILRNPPPTPPTPRKDNLMLAPINAETTTFPALLPRCPTSEIRTNLRISRITLEGREERKERGTGSGVFSVDARQEKRAKETKRVSKFFDS